MCLRIVLPSTPRLCDIFVSDHCTSNSVTSIASNVPFATGPVPDGSQPCSISMARSVTTHALPWRITRSGEDYVIANHRAGELRDRGHPEPDESIRLLLF